MIEHVFIAEEVTRSKKYGPRINVLAMPHHLASRKGVDAIS